jgi:signal transduction histidine kinase
MKKIFTLFFLTVIAVSSFAQDKEKKIIDSLKIELDKTKSDTTKVNILNEMCSLNYFNNTMIAMGYSETALNLSTKIKWKKGMAVAYNHLGICNLTIKKNLTSIYCFQKSLVYYKELKDQKNISDSYNHLGMLYGEKEKYSQALAYFNMAYQINTKIRNIYQTANDLYGIGNIYYKIRNYQKALDYYEKANQKYMEASHIFGMGSANFNMGMIYVIQEKHFKALECYNIAIEKFTESKSFYQIGGTYLEMGKENYKFSFDKKKEKRKILKLVIKNLKEAIRIFTDLKSFDKVNECYIVLSKTYEEIGEYKLAIDSYKNYIKIDQTFLTYEKENEITEYKNIRVFESKNNLIEIQKQKIKKDRRKVYLLVTIVLAVVILLMLFFWLYLSKRKATKKLKSKNKIISNINKQKDKFFSIIAHDLRGPFNGFLGLTELLAEDIEDMDKEEIQFAAVNMRSSATNLNRLLENLLEWSRMEQGLIPFAPQENQLQVVVEECITTLQAATDKKQIKISTEISENTKVFADNNILHAVIRNILSNAVKFTPKGGSINIQGKEVDKNTIIAIKDSGIGMDTKMLKNLFELDVKTNRTGTDDEPSTGLGLILCKEFVEKHGGKIWVESEEDKGTTFYFSFPKQ